MPLIKSICCVYKMTLNTHVHYNTQRHTDTHSICLGTAGDLLWLNALACLFPVQIEIYYIDNVAWRASYC